MFRGNPRVGTLLYPINSPPRISHDAVDLSLFLSLLHSCLSYFPPVLSSSSYIKALGVNHHSVDVLTALKQSNCPVGQLL